MPTVSVIILAWNSGDFLKTAVASILNQTLSDLELLIVDNGSADGSVERALRARPDLRIRVLRQETNLGVAAGHNLGIAAARSPWVAIMDADDWSHPMRLELQLKAMAADPSLGVVGTGARWMEHDGRIAEAYPMFYEAGEIVAYVPYGMPVLHPTLLYRREIVQQIPYRQGIELCSDYDVVARISEAHRIGVVSLPLFHYRRHPGSSTLRRATFSQAGVCAIRLGIARRRAGRPDGYAELAAEANRFTTPTARVVDVYRHFARRAAGEGFDLLAAFHAALAVRAEGGVTNHLRYARHLAAAVIRSDGAWRDVAAGLGKAPFWMMLKRAGFPPFPRY